MSEQLYLLYPVFDLSSEEKNFKDHIMSSHFFGYERRLQLEYQKECVRTI